MGFQKPDLTNATRAIQKSLTEIHSPYNDGFIQSSCKQDLYVLKCWLEDEYSKLPTFVGEEKLEQQRLIQVLKKIQYSARPVVGLRRLVVTGVKVVAHTCPVYWIRSCPATIKQDSTTY